MKVRKLLAHRARLSFTKRWAYKREDGALIMWNTRSRSARLRK